MNSFKALRLLLGIAGLVGIIVGAGQLFFPVAFEASAGISLGNNTSLLSEIRAAGGALLIAGIIIITGAFSSGIRNVSLMVASLFYLSYGVSRLLGMLVDGMPQASLVIATVAELVLGVLSFWALQSVPKQKLVKERA